MKKDKTIELERFPLTPSAMSAYKKSTKLFGRKQDEGHPAPRKFLRFARLRELAIEMDRQITEDDLQVLLRDEGRHKCLVTGKSKRAISWVALGSRTIPRIAKILNSGMSIKECRKEIRYSGGFYTPTNKDIIIFVSGVPYPDEGDELSPLCAAIESEETLINRWGLSFRDSIAKKEAIAEAQIRREEAIKARHDPNQFIRLGNLVDFKMIA